VQQAFDGLVRSIHSSGILSPQANIDRMLALPVCTVIVAR
jgi:hypothetical protein